MRALSLAKRARRVVSSCMASSQWSGVSARVGSEKKSAESQSNPTLAPESSRHERGLPKDKPRPGKYHVEIARVTRDACVQRSPPR